MWTGGGMRAIADEGSTVGIIILYFMSASFHRVRQEKNHDVFLFELAELEV